MRRGRVLFLLVTLCLLSVASAWADEVIHVGTPDTIRDLRDSAAKDRAFADEQQKRADAWRDLARSAQAEADKASDPDDRKMWLDDVARRIARAEEIEADNARLRRLADEKEARAARLEAAYKEKYDEAGNLRPPAPQPAPAQPAPAQPAPAQPAPAQASEPQPAAAAEEPPCWRLDEASAVGVWRDTKDQSPFAIRPKNPDLPPASQAFEALTMSRTWEGTYDPAQACGIPRFTFRHKPKAEEMNPSVPLWARKAVEGKLEWIIELKEGGTCGSQRLAAEWYPGEIGWREDGEGQADGAWIAGKGQPRKFELAPDLVLEGDVVAAPTLVVGIQGQRDPMVNPIDAMIEQQRFDVFLTLPKEVAKEVGTETSVTVKNLTNGDSTSLTVATVPAALERDYVIYQLTAPATIADIGEEGARDYLIIPLNPGDRISLKADNADRIEVSWRDARHEFRIYETWVQLGIARHARRFDELREIYNAIIAGPDATREQREQALRRLRMINNAQTLIAQPDVLDHVKYAIGDFYLETAPPYIGIDYTGEKGLPVLQRSQLTWYGKEQKPNKYGFLWTSVEEAEVLGAMSAARESYRERAMIDIGVAFTMGMYSGVVAATGVGDIYTIGSGYDIYGKKVTAFERFMTAVGMISGTVLVKLGPQAVKNLLQPANGKIGAPSRTAMKPVQIRTGALPPALNGKVPQAVVAKSGARPQPITCASGAARPTIEYPKPKPTIEYPPKPKPTIEYPTPKPTIEYPTPANVNVDSATQAYVSLSYGPHARIVNVTPEMAALKQQFGTCNCMASMYAKFKQTGHLTGQGQALYMLNKRGIVPVDRYVQGGGSLHVTNAEIEQFVPAFNGQSINLPNANVSMEGLRAWHGRGWSVKDVLRFPGDTVNHAVIIDDFLTDAKGQITGVRVFDSNVGGIVEVPICEYTRLRQPIDSQGVQLLKFDKRPDIKPVGKGQGN